MKANILTATLAATSALLIVWGALVSFDWVEEYMATKQSPAYEALPFDFKLKANPEDVIFSEAFTAEDGKDIVKYAYVAGEVGPQLNEDISRRTPESYTEVINQFNDEEGKPMETLKTTFMSKPQFYQKDGQWRQVEYATTTPEIFAMSGAIPHVKKRELAERLLPGRPVFGATSTFYPDANTETNSVDGGFSKAGVSAVSNNGALGSAAGGSADYVDDSGTSASASSYNYYDGEAIYNAQVYKAIFLFHTASLGSLATISSATFSLYVTSKTNDDNDGSDLLYLVTSGPSSNTALVTSDFSSLGATSQSTSNPDITSISTGAYLDFTLNGTGLGNVSKTGVTKFGVREYHEIATSGLCDTCSSGATFSTADQTGSSQDPKLVVVYTSPNEFSMGNWFPF